MGKIIAIKGREVLDSRGNPTVEVEVHTDKGMGRAMVPSGASKGSHEAVELRDGDLGRYFGDGVLKAVKNVDEEISKSILGMESSEQEAIDKKMIDLDGTENKSRLGANAILAVSLAAARASANEKSQFLFEYLNPKGGSLPIPMMNVINGGVHADSGLDIQEFMIMPIKAASFRERLRVGAEIFHTLKSMLKEAGWSVAVGDEGGFAPKFSGNEEALDFLMKATEKAGYKLWEDVKFALDCAATEFYDAEKKLYKIKVNGKYEELSNGDLVSYYDILLRKYPIVSIEDSHSEDDWDGFKKMMKSVESGIQLVGDDMLVTNVKRLEKAIEEEAANAILIKINQIGTLTETFEAIRMAKNAGWNTIISHRSGETEDTSIADIAVAMECGQIKTGSLSRGERIAKYNQLLRIEEKLMNG